MNNNVRPKTTSNSDRWHDLEGSQQRASMSTGGRKIVTESDRLKKIYINTSIPYVNSIPHIGYALEAVQTDVLARFWRLRGYDVYFVSGADENAIKNVEAAQKQGIPTQELVNKNSKAFHDLKFSLNLSFDQFIRTTSEKHKKGAQKLWNLCKKDIYKKKYRGLYCVGCETFYNPGELKDDICLEHNRKLEIIEEENYFFPLSRYAKKLKELFEKNEIEVYPPFRKNELSRYIDQGLEDFSVSRPLARTKGWGIPVPDDSSQTIYVWFDALANYITALDFYNNGDLFKKYWLENKNRINVIGKNITKFHLLYWPAMLLSAGLPTPTRVYVHGFITVNGQKMSKSLGNVVDPDALVKKYGTDAVRYYLLREIPSLDDGDYSNSRMVEIYASDLANELGNLVSRITTIADKDGLVIEQSAFDADSLLDKDLDQLFNGFQFNKILELVWEDVKRVNKETDEYAPWKKSPQERKGFLEKILKDIHEIGHLLLPFIPDSAQKIIQATDGKIRKISPLFPRIVKG